MKHLKLKIVTLILATTINFFGTSQEEPDQVNTRKFSIEIDPATFAFKGYGFHLRLQPKKYNHLFIGIGTYAMNMPDVLINFNKNNKDKGWNIRLNQGYSLFGEYHFNEVNHQWFIGSQIGIQEYKIQNEAAVGHEKYTNLLAMGYFGYTIKPFNNPFYIKPWAGIGYTTKLSGQSILADLAYDISPVTMFTTLHIGYTF